MEYNAAQLLFMFFLFCNIGWIQESIIESVYHKRLINRGFLHGPYIPIYGIGGMTILIVCMPFRNNGVVVYFVGLLSCTVLEYFVGWLMETLFHKQFWDYSMMKLTYKNRISLVSSIFWGLLALFMVYVLYDIVESVVLFFHPNILAIYDVIMLVAMTVDSIITISSHIALKEKLKKLPYDKAKRIVTEKFIQMGGAVMKRRQRFNELISKMKMNVDANDIESEHNSEKDNSDITEGDTNEG